MELRIRNMICRHCIAEVERILSQLNLEHTGVSLGAAQLTAPELPVETLARLDTMLEDAGFQRISDPEERLLEQIRHSVIHHVRSETECRLKLSACIEEHIGIPYDTLSRLFSSREGRTIEKFHIAQKIERVKELLAYRENTLAEIADITGYSSAAHLSRQFKDVTGMTPTAYLSHIPPRTPLPEV